jgi:hypothetical protein
VPCNSRLLPVLSLVSLPPNKTPLVSSNTHKINTIPDSRVKDKDKDTDKGKGKGSTKDNRVEALLGGWVWGEVWEGT